MEDTNTLSKSTKQLPIQKEEMQQGGKRYGASECLLQLGLFSLPVSSIVELVWPRHHFGTQLDKSTIIHQWLGGSTAMPNLTAHGCELATHSIMATCTLAGALKSEQHDTLVALSLMIGCVPLLLFGCVPLLLSGRCSPRSRALEYRWSLVS